MIGMGLNMIEKTFEGDSNRAQTNPHKRQRTEAAMGQGGTGYSGTVDDDVGA